MMDVFFNFCTFNFIQRWGVGWGGREGIRRTSTARFHSRALLRDGMPTVFTFFLNHSYINLLDQLLHSNTTKAHKESGLRQTLCSLLQLNCCYEAA